jgi:hypothetical protein
MYGVDVKARSCYSFTCRALVQRCMRKAPLASNSPQRLMSQTVGRVAACALMALAAMAPAAAMTLHDHHIAGGIMTRLDGTWQASAAATVGDAAVMSIPGRVPGDLISDLFHAGAIPEP